MTASKTQSRIPFVDVARFGAMALVFYGHFIERIMYLKNPTAAAHYKFIYSFHMVLFIVLAGYVAREGDRHLGPGKFFKHRLLSRLLPFASFTLSLMCLNGIFYHFVNPPVAGWGVAHLPGSPRRSSSPWDAS